MPIARLLAFLAMPSFLSNSSSHGMSMLCASSFPNLAQQDNRLSTCSHSFLATHRTPLILSCVCGDPY